MFPPIYCRRRYAICDFVINHVSPTLLQRDYFGAHTFRVLPGKENAKLKTGEDIREFQLTANIPFTHLFY